MVEPRTVTQHEPRCVDRSVPSPSNPPSLSVMGASCADTMTDTEILTGLKRRLECAREEGDDSGDGQPNSVTSADGQGQGKERVTRRR